MTQSEILELVADLIEATLASPTRRGIARGSLDALAPLGVIALELGWADAKLGRARVVEAIARDGGASVTETRRRLAGSRVTAALRAGRPELTTLPTGRRRPISPEHRRAARRGARAVAVLPILDPTGGAGFAVLHLDARGGRALAATDGLLPLLATVFRVATRAGRLVERVAGLSRRAIEETTELRRRLEDSGDREPIVARSASMRAALEAADLVAGHDVTVLIRGESGTGKELIARRIHERSARRGRPFLRVNAGALPETLLETELFGHERGAFTGATGRHVGLFERSDGGTLLLDEVAELAPAAQVRLLRVLQEGELHRVGGEEPIRVDVRVLAATHRPLEELVASGSFREDLFYRLDVFPIRLAPLRDRPDDVAPLAERIVAETSARLGLPRAQIGRAAMGRLLAHRFPGNVRELQNVLERALILCRGRREIEAADLDLAPPRIDATRIDPTPRGTGAPLGSDGATATLDDAIRAAIEAALRATGGKLYGDDGAAAQLGVRPTTLQGKMRRLAIDRTAFVGR